MLTASDTAPARSWRAIVPSDTVDLPAGCRAIYVGGAGNISLLGDDDAIVTFTAVPAGTILPCGAVRVRSSGTNATLMVALY